MVVVLNPIRFFTVAEPQCSHAEHGLIHHFNVTSYEGEVPSSNESPQVWTLPTKLNQPVVIHPGFP